VRNDRARLAGLAAACIAVAGLLSGCFGNASTPPTNTTAPKTPFATTSAPPTPLATPSATTPTNSENSAMGCPPNGDSIPEGASTAVLGDVDDDGEPDAEFYSEVGGFSYGIHTASGATIFLQDDLAGPGKHSGWSARLDGPQLVVTVLDDGRSASLHAFVNCTFRTTMGIDGTPYRFQLNGFGENGTGVACNNRNGGTLVEGVLAQQRSDGLYDIKWTHINISADGTTATNGDTETRYASLAKSDPLVQQAMGSYCNEVPKVGSSGR
jgi:hypothetical protein